MTNERWLKWAIGRYHRSKGYKVSMKPAQVGNAMVDGIAIGPEGERIAIEVKSPRDDIVRGVGQCYGKEEEGRQKLEAAGRVVVSLRLLRWRHAA